MTERSPSEIERTFVLQNRQEDLQAAQQALLEAVDQEAYDQTSSFAIRLAMEEAVSNAFKHGNKNDPDKNVHVRFRVSSEAVEIEIEDEGPGFDISAVPDPTQPENIEIPSGRGIVLMRAYMTRVEYIPPGNRVMMRFERSAEPANGSN